MLHKYRNKLHDSHFTVKLNGYTPPFILKYAGYLYMIKEHCASKCVNFVTLIINYVMI
jgi:hypothetical protein